MKQFEGFYDGEVVNHVATHNNLYAQQCENRIFVPHRKEVKVFLSILFVFGYATLPDPKCSRKIKQMLAIFLSLWL